jgi:hypothetical protein
LRRSRLTRANIKIIGAADGIIIAAIITAHMTNISRYSAVPQERIMGMAMDMSMCGSLMSMCSMSQAR